MSVTDDGISYRTVNGLEVTNEKHTAQVAAVRGKEKKRIENIGKIADMWEAADTDEARRAVVEFCKMLGYTNLVDKYKTKLVDKRKRELGK